MTYMHEHVRIDLSREKGDPDCLLDEFDHIAGELRDLSSRGLRRMVDMSCRGMGRDYGYIDRLEEETGIEILVSAGFYKEPFLPEEVYSSGEKELAKLLIGDIENGAEGSPRKARIIGEIGSSLNTMTDAEQKVFRAAAAAHGETGIPVSTHTTLGTLGYEQVQLLKKLGVEPGKLIIGHLDLADDLDLIFRVLDEGVYVEFDTIGKIKYLPEERRVAFIRECCSQGYSGQILLSMDITRRSHLKANGGIGYAYLPDVFLPLLVEAGVSDSNITDMLERNPAALLGEVV
ncbi:phosphotriesterase family protein [Breznakiella homolactica]|uniref:Phosphotriesterase-related protein n=1 Tax=Breznakiella homolactica TaxID=2798577 RepID=A0A7T7XR14_9SPIR|nr:phosphotriesterase-related protein [Breznakiella homolactica]QQO10915.1 phosphotriesterase-related protein [Breznakiella homolactica]